MNSVLCATEGEQFASQREPVSQPTTGDRSALEEFIRFGSSRRAVEDTTGRARTRDDMTNDDAQVRATAWLNQVPMIFSEDFNSNAMPEGVRFVNPFVSDFIL